MKKLITIAVAGLALCGCTTFSVDQVDESPNERKITSKIKGTAWFSSAQAITQLKTLQSDKSQSTGFNSLAQQGATNVVGVIEAVTKLVEAANPAP